MHFLGGYYFFFFFFSMIFYVGPCYTNTIGYRFSFATQCCLVWVNSIDNLKMHCIAVWNVSSTICITLYHMSLLLKTWMTHLILKCGADQVTVWLFTFSPPFFFKVIYQNEDHDFDPFEDHILYTEYYLVLSSFYFCFRSLYIILVSVHIYW